MRFLIDQQLPPSLIGWLAARGHSAEHVRNVGLRDADDRDIWRYAQQQGAVIITKDQDFAERRSRAVDGPLIIWLRIGNATTPALLAGLDASWPQVDMALLAGAPVIEVR